MMKEYLREREKETKVSAVTGLVLTAAVHLLACLLLGFTGLKYIYPPPQEQTFLIDFTEDEQPRPKRASLGRQPQAEEVDRTKPVEIVQQSESPYVSQKENKSPKATPDDHGDVEVPAPPQEEPNPNALFPGMSKKDSSLAPHGAEKAGDKFKEGAPDGNTSKGTAEGKPNAHLKGRNVLGALPVPVYKVQNEGIVVVDIWVDNYGNVQKAVPGGQGTTVTDKTLWNAARVAAMNSHFNQDANAPQQQHGTITYIFKLK